VIFLAWEKTDNTTRVYIENHLKCCGFDGKNYTNGTPCPPAPYALPGCYDALTDWLRSSIKIVAIAGLSLGAIQLIALFFSCCLCWAMPSAKDTEHQRLLKESHKVNASYYP